jgi:NAD dependent epimerase/dehydratase family enzyme
VRIVIAGGTGLLGRLLSRAFRAKGHDVVVLSRSSGPGAVAWDGRTLGPWAEHVDGAGAVVNLAGRTVDCRYTPRHLREMMDSRVESTRVIGEAIARASRPPPVWLQMSTATIYAHRRDAPNDEPSGRIGGDEPDAPASWRWSIDIARAWERTLELAATPRTRKVAMRTAMVMSSAPGGVYVVLRRLALAGLPSARATSTCRGSTSRTSSGQ